MKPKSSYRQALAVSAVFAAAASAGYAAYGGAARSRSDNVRDAAAPPRDDGLVALPPEKIVEGRRRAAVMRSDFHASVADALAGAGGAARVPQGECIEALATPNPGTDPSPDGSEMDIDELFDAFAVERKKAERRADAGGSRSGEYKIVPLALSTDRAVSVRYLNADDGAKCEVSAASDGSMVDPKGARLVAGTHIFVISQDNKIYSSPVHRGFVVHHSSFVAGQPVKFAGEFTVGADGKVSRLNNRSGHYLPPPRESIAAAASIMMNAGIDLRKTLFDGVGGP